MNTTTHPCFHARTTPSKPAVIVASTGATITYAELESRSNKGARLLRDLGLRPGDHVAVLLDNTPDFFEIFWAAQRSGMYFTPISTHLNVADAAYILNDCEAKVLIASAAVGEVAGGLLGQAPAVKDFFAIGDLPGYKSWQQSCERFPDTPLDDEVSGHTMMYSSGTTGRPKGISVAFANNPIGFVSNTMAKFSEKFGYGPDTVYLSPAPLYHAAPLAYTTLMQRLGGVVVLMEKFDPEDLLKYIERYKVTHTQVVPTMFIRMLRLPESVRRKYDLSSMCCALHSAAPCPINVKEAMLEWWGPVIYEYYSGSEGSGCTAIGPEEWMTHKGSVGRALTGAIKVLSEDGVELPVGSTGEIYFVDSPKFQYHKDEDKTKKSRNERGWGTYGDVGCVDDDGYLYLTDRKAYMIVTGGVNVYPQEAENVLSGHPKVVDVAVFGVPNDEFGEEVKAVVEPVDMAEAGPELAAELIEFCRQHLSSIKCPRSIDFEASLPRQENGKLYKRVLRDRYWTGRQSRIA